MKIDELIEELERVREEHGNLEVRCKQARPIQLGLSSISHFQSQIFEGDVNDKFVEL